MNINYFLLACFFLLGSPVTSAGSFYKWVDTEGRTHYSDVARPHAAIMPTQISPPAKTTTHLQTINAEKKKQTAPHQNSSTQTIMIEQPKDQETLQNTEGKIAIVISSNTPLKEGQRWIVLLDGKKRGEPQTQPTILLENIERGEHTLQIQAIDIHDKVAASSATITFYVHQTTIQQQTTP